MNTLPWLHPDRVAREVHARARPVAGDVLRLDGERARIRELRVGVHAVHRVEVLGSHRAGGVPVREAGKGVDAVHGPSLPSQPLSRTRILGSS